MNGDTLSVIRPSYCWLAIFWCLVFLGGVVRAASPIRVEEWSNLASAAQNDQVQPLERQKRQQPQFDWNSKDTAGNTLLHLASREGSAQVVSWLIQQPGVQLDQRNSLQETALMLAAFKGHLPVVKLLRQRGAAVNFSGWSPLLYAAQAGHLTIVEYLLSSGADLAATAPNGLSVLMLAVQEGHYDMVKLLVSHGADVQYQTADGKTALLWAEERGFPKIIALLRQAGAER